MNVYLESENGIREEELKRLAEEWGHKAAKLRLVEAKASKTGALGYCTTEDPVLIDLCNRISEDIENSGVVLREGYAKGYTSDQMGVFVDSFDNRSYDGM